MGFSTDFFTVDIPDQDTLVFYRLVNVVPRLKEIQGWLDFLLGPLANGIGNFGNLTEAERLTIIDYLLNHNWTGLKTYLESKFPEEDPDDLQQLIETFLYGYYFDTLEIANSLAIGIDAEAYQIIPEGTKVQYRPTRTSKASTIYTLGNIYELTRWRKQIFNDGTFSYEVWAVFYYTNTWTGDVPTWQYQKSAAAANKAAFGGTIIVQGPTIFGDDNTFYIHEYESSWWEQIAARRETFLPIPNHYYDHDVTANMLFVTDPATRGGIYPAFLGPDWEAHTDHPDTMGNPWPGDAGEKPYDDDLYNWINTTVNPPGFTDLTAEFLLSSVSVKEIFYGEGRDPQAYAPKRNTGSRGPSLMGLGPLAGISPLNSLIGAKRRRKI